MRTSRNKSYRKIANVGILFSRREREAQPGTDEADAKVWHKTQRHLSAPSVTGWVFMRRLGLFLGLYTRKYHVELIISEWRYHFTLMMIRVKVSPHLDDDRVEVSPHLDDDRVEVSPHPNDD